MASYGRAVPYPELCESVRLVALELLAEGRKTDVFTLRARGVRGNTQRIWMALADLTRSGAIPPECRHDKPVRRGIPSPRPDDPEPGEIEDGVESLRGHAPEVKPVKRESGVWEWLAAKYWTEDRRALYRRA